MQYIRIDANLHKLEITKKDNATCLHTANLSPGDYDEFIYLADFLFCCKFYYPLLFVLDILPSFIKGQINYICTIRVWIFFV